MAWKALPWLFVPALGLAELGGHFYFSRRPPGLDEWRAARGAVAEARGHDELVVVAPAWAEPNARHAFGDSLMPLADVARADASSHPRAIEVSILGASSPELKGWNAITEKRVGKFRLRVLENPAPPVVTYNFVDRVENATVFEVRGAAEQPCPWTPAARKSAGGLHGDPAFPGQRHQCPGGDAHFVGVTVVEDSEWRGRRCLWAPPAASSSAALSIRYHDVPLGRVIRGHGESPWWTERELRGAPIEVTVLAGGESVGTFVHRAGESWKGFEFPLGVRERTRADVEFRVTTSRGRERQFCFEADSR